MLLVAYDSDEVVGHLGVLPDRIYVGLNQERLGWLTAWWANPDRKFAGVGLMLLMRALKLYNGRLGASGFSDDARRVYDATKRFVPIEDRHGMCGFARLNLGSLFRRRHPSLGKLRVALRMVDGAVNAHMHLRQLLWQKRHRMPHSCEVEYLTEVDQEAEEFIQRHSSEELTRRGARELNWIMRYPWIVCAPVAPASSFHFSSQAERYSVHWAKIYMGGESLAAVLMLTVIDGHMIVPYCYHIGHARLLARLLCHILVQQRAERLTIYRPELVEAISTLRFPWLKVIQKRRTWIGTRECAGLGTREFMMQDGDGDCAFSV